VEDGHGDGECELRRRIREIDVYEQAAGGSLAGCGEYQRHDGPVGGGGEPVGGAGRLEETKT
jgi:hypothetical protein